ncbi:MAG: methionyl-tRNA formyltransferase [Kiritimatiellia bacterium]|jgi:methionyl-tRNA formyltransferase
MEPKHYVVATIRPWNIACFHSTISRLPGVWHLIQKPTDLNLATLTEIKPRYIFFPHWSDKVPVEIVSKYECVCFHETDVPYGRGGSPLQNLIVRGHKETMVTALRMVNEFDAGPIYAKHPLSLLGLAEEIYIRTAEIVSKMIADIVTNEPTPKPQIGDPTVFNRRKPEDSRVPMNLTSLESLFDYLRMLDAAEYPQAFLDYGRFRLTFTRPAFRTEKVEATVTITCRPTKENTE